MSRLQVNSKRLCGIDTSKQRSFLFGKAFHSVQLLFDIASVLGSVSASFIALARTQHPCDSDSSSVTNWYDQIDIHSVDQMIPKSNHPLCHID